MRTWSVAIDFSIESLAGAGLVPGLGGVGGVVLEGVDLGLHLLDGLRRRCGGRGGAHGQAAHDDGESRQGRHETHGTGPSSARERSGAGRHAGGLPLPFRLPGELTGSGGKIALRRCAARPRGRRSTADSPQGKWVPGSARDTVSGGRHELDGVLAAVGRQR